MQVIHDIYGDTLTRYPFLLADDRKTFIPLSLLLFLKIWNLLKLAITVLAMEIFHHVAAKHVNLK